MFNQQPIQPFFGQGQTLVTSAVSAAFANPVLDISKTNYGKQICLTNTSAVYVHVRITDSAPLNVATAADYPVPPNSQQVITKPPGTFMSAISPAGAGSIHAMDCDGY